MMKLSYRAIDVDDGGVAICGGAAAAMGAADARVVGLQAALALALHSVQQLQLTLSGPFCWPCCHTLARPGIYAISSECVPEACEHQMAKWRTAARQRPSQRQRQRPASRLLPASPLRGWRQAPRQALLASDWPAAGATMWWEQGARAGVSYVQ